MAALPIELSWKAPIQGHPDWNYPDDVAVWVSVTKLDAAWKLDDGFYIGSGGSGAAIDDRYARFGVWIASTSESVDLPMVAFEKGVVSFSDGRHRFAWLRDHGVQAMPVQVSSEQRQEFENLFGVSDRVSTITS